VATIAIEAVGACLEESMNTYALRCRTSDYETMLQLGTALGALEVVDGVVFAPSGAWDYIGTKLSGEPPEEGQQDTRELVGGALDPYIHVNLRTPVDLRERAQELAGSNPEIGVALLNISRFFVVDSEGNAVFPEVPMRVFL
jgi:hypothetical protein